MSGVSLPVSRPAGRALLIGSAGCRVEPHGLLQKLGFQCAEIDDPYAAMAELHRRPLVYWALVLSLNSLYREELQLIAAVKRRYPHVEIWLTQTDGRAAALAEAMRLGADGLLLEDGFHRAALSPMPEAPVVVRSIATPPQTTTNGYRAAAPPIAVPPLAPAATAPAPAPLPLIDSGLMDFSDHDDATGEPILSAEELRALLQDPPTYTFIDDNDV